MKKSMLIAGATVIAIAVPALAAHHQNGQNAGPMPMMMQDVSRADVAAKVKAHFAEVDADKDGAITMDEIKARRDALRTERMDAHFKAMDKDSDGAISRAEFDAAHAMSHGDHDGMAMAGGGMAGGGMAGGPGMMERGADQRPDMMKMGDRMFERADANKDGKVTLAEATTAALAHFDKVDANKDGKITAGERMNFWKSMRDQSKGRHHKPS